MASAANVERRNATRDGKTYFHPNLIPTHNRLPVAFTHGQGVWVWDEDGRKYLDALAGIAVNTLGHAHPRLVRAIADQAAKIIHISNNFHIEVQERLAERLAALSGMQQAFFVNSGCEANECAIKLARLYGTKRGVVEPHVIVMEKAFHGRTMATLSASGNAKVQKGFEPLVSGFTRVPFGDVEAIEAAAKDRRSVAVLLEVIQGEGGINLLSGGRLEAIRAVCDRHDMLLMIDEVQTGIARTGRYFGFQHTTVTPDAMPLAKGLGGGVPVGACLVAGKAVGVFDVGSHGSTFGGNPLACAAALATLEVIEEDGLCDNAREVGEYLKRVLRERLAGIAGVVEVRGEGLLIGVELDRPCGEMMRLCLDAGLLLSVTAGNVVRIAPPLILSRSEADRIADILVPVIAGFLRRPSDKG